MFFIFKLKHYEKLSFIYFYNFNIYYSYFFNTLIMKIKNQEKLKEKLTKMLGSQNIQSFTFSNDGSEHNHGFDVNFHSDKGFFICMKQIKLIEKTYTVKLLTISNYGNSGFALLFR